MSPSNTTIPIYPSEPLHQTPPYRINLSFTSINQQHGRKGVGNTTPTGPGKEAGRYYSLLKGRRLEDTSLHSPGKQCVSPSSYKRTRLLTSISHVINFRSIFLPSSPPRIPIFPSPSYHQQNQSYLLHCDHCDFFAKKSSLNILSKITVTFLPKSLP